MTNEELVALVGAAISLVFSYFPMAQTWFEAKPPNIKRLIQIGIAVVVAWVVFGLSCAGILDTFTCDQPGAIAVVRLIGAFLVWNQTTYALTPR